MDARLEEIFDTAQDGVASIFAILKKDLVAYFNRRRSEWAIENVTLRSEKDKLLAETKLLVALRSIHST